MASESAGGVKEPHWVDTGLPWTGMPARRLHRSFVTASGVEVHTGEDVAALLPPNHSIQTSLPDSESPVSFFRLWALFECDGKMCAAVTPLLSAGEVSGKELTDNGGWVHERELLLAGHVFGMDEDPGDPIGGALPLERVLGPIQVRCPYKSPDMSDWGEQGDMYKALWQAAGEPTPAMRFRDGLPDGNNDCWSCWLLSEEAEHFVIFRDWGETEEGGHVSTPLHDDAAEVEKVADQMRLLIKKCDICRDKKSRPPNPSADPADWMMDSRPPPDHYAGTF